MSGSKSGKRSDSDYVQRGFYVHKPLYRKLRIAHAENEELDTSDMVNEALGQYFSAGAPSSGVPLLGGVSCGEPLLTEQNIERYLYPLSDLAKADFALRVKGDSMEPRIRDGDIVFVRAQPDVESGEIAVIQMGEEATVKRVKKSDGTVTLCPDNPSHEENPMDPGAVIIGKVIGAEVRF